MARHQEVMDEQLCKRMGIEVRRLGFLVDSPASRLFPLGSLGQQGTPGALAAANLPLSIHVPVFSPQEGVADSAAAQPVLPRQGMEGEYSDELRLRLLRESQRRVEQEQAWARVQVRPFCACLESWGCA